MILSGKDKQKKGFLRISHTLDMRENFTQADAKVVLSYIALKAPSSGRKK